ncbi:hypothetical protein PR002_g2999 [Phytophthora rubi]|uniref:Uncharacterized protein n=1 Tax=Phytophthora rubi TaxID=129364 RepID=A0A6A3NUC5_9STRA|nr:hypothetical protein PR002_g2999 [Phytophthora rubi]
MTSIIIAIGIITLLAVWWISDLLRGMNLLDTRSRDDCARARELAAFELESRHFASWSGRVSPEINPGESSPSTYRLALTARAACYQLEQIEL